VCDSCPVAEQCLAHAIEHNETSGMWGGWTPEERRKGERVQARKTSGRVKGRSNGDRVQRSHITDEQRREIVWLVEHEGMRVGTAAAKVRISETTAYKVLRQAGYPQAWRPSDSQEAREIMGATTETGHEAAPTAPVALERPTQEVTP
jgi:hypothetical protein